MFFFCLKHWCFFILLINVKMPTVVGILTFTSRINFMLIWVEHQKSLITLGPGFYVYCFLVALSFKYLHSGYFSCFCFCLPLFYSKLTFSKSSFRNTFRVSGSLDPGQDRVLSVLIWIQNVCTGQNFLIGRKKNYLNFYVSSSWCHTLVCGCGFFWSQGYIFFMLNSTEH